MRLIFISLLSLMAILWASASWGTELYIPPIKGESGQAIEVPIMIDSVDNLAGVKLVMKYDPELLSFKEGSKTTHTDSLMHIVNDKEPGLLIVVMAGAKGIKGKDFSILKLIFEVKKGLKGNHATEIQITEAQLMSDQLKDIQSKITVNPIIISGGETSAN